MELADVTDSKSVGLITRAGSTPATGTTSEGLGSAPFPRFAEAPRKLRIRRVLLPFQTGSLTGDSRFGHEPNSRGSRCLTDRRPCFSFPPQTRFAAEMVRIWIALTCRSAASFISLAATFLLRVKSRRDHSAASPLPARSALLDLRGTPIVPKALNYLGFRGPLPLFPESGVYMPAGGS